jgi:hypothetical protein
MASVPLFASTSAAAIFPSYISASTNQLVVTLVRYFNNLPLNVPRKFAFLHQSSQSVAIQQLLFQQIASGSANSLLQALLAIPLPTTPAGDLKIYDATVATAVNASKFNVLDSVAQVWNGTLPVIPANLAGTSTSTSGTTSPTSGTSSTGGTSSGGA